MDVLQAIASKAKVVKLSWKKFECSKDGPNTSKNFSEDDRHKGKVSIRKDTQGPKILKAETENAINYTKNNKVAGPNEIAVEQIKGLGEFGIEKLAFISNEIYDNGKIPEDLSKSRFITLPKKSGLIECELHHTISLTSNTTKILLRVLMKRARSKLRTEIPNVQYGFVEDKNTRNAIFIVHMICERAIEMQKKPLSIFH